MNPAARESLQLALERGTEVAAPFYSLVETAKLAGVEPDGNLRTAARHAIPGERIPLPHELAKA